MLRQTVEILLTIAVCFSAGRLAESFVQRSVAQRNQSVATMLSIIIWAVVILITLISVLSVFGLTSAVNTVTISILVVTIIVNTYANSLIDGLIVLLEGNFRIGHVVSAFGFTGPIEKMGIRMSQMRDGTDHNPVFIPTTNFFGSIIKRMDQLTSPTNRPYGLGWKPDLPDQRDYQHKVGVVQIPPIIDLSSGFLPVRNQLILSSCTGFGIASVIEYEAKRQGLPDIVLSPLFLYYNERAMENSINSDDGAMIRDGMKSINAQGVCEEALWPYDVTRVYIRPPDAAYENALHHEALVYESVEQTHAGIQSALAEGFPVVCGVSVYNSFMADTVARTGIVPLPQPNEEFVGGHCIVIVGKDDSKNLYKFRNHWNGWGDGGYGYLPYDYLVNPDLSDNFWVVKLVNN